MSAGQLTAQAGLGARRASSTAGGGTALSTTAGLIGLLQGTKHVQLIARNFATAVVVKYALNPFLIVLKTADALATVTDYSTNAQDVSTSTVVTLSSLDTLANNDAVYIGSRTPIRGLSVDVNAANSTTSTLTVSYWNGTAWTDISATDNTASGGATFAVDGTIVWTVPTDWVKASLADINHVLTTDIGDFAYRANEMFWLQLKVSAALDSSTTLNSIYAMNRSTSYAEIIAGAQDEHCEWGPDGYGCIEALTDAGTANLIVNCFGEFP